MTSTTKAKIFLADQRGVDETASVRTVQTFNTETYYHPHRQAFAQLCLLNDVLLAGGASMHHQAPFRTHLLLLPVAGAVVFSNNDPVKGAGWIAAGQSLLQTMEAGESIILSNAFADDTVNFLLFGFHGDTDLFASSRINSFADVNAHAGSLVPVISPAVMGSMAVSVGKFAGRQEAVYHVGEQRRAAFAFVLEGAFEVEGRLLHARDGLGLWNCAELEMEALSNDALIVVVDMGASAADH